MLHIYVVGFFLELRKAKAIESLRVLKDLLFLVDDAGCSRYMGPLGDVEAVMKCKSVGIHDLSVKDNYKNDEHTSSCIGENILTCTEALHPRDLADETVDFIHFADGFFGPPMSFHRGVDLFTKGPDIFRRCGQFKEYLWKEL